jgi:hypothetical protein
MFLYIYITNSWGYCLFNRNVPFTAVEGSFLLHNLPHTHTHTHTHIYIYIYMHIAPMNLLYITNSWGLLFAKIKKMPVVYSIEMYFSLRLKGASSCTTCDEDISLKNCARWRSVLTHCPAIILKEFPLLKQDKALSWTRRECSNKMHVVWDLTFGTCCWHTHTHTSCWQLKASKQKG